MKQLLIGGALVIVLIAGIIYFMQSDDMTAENENGDTNTQQTTDMTNDNQPEGTSDSTEAHVTLAENETGNSANVASVTLPRPGFVVIYKVNSNGEASYAGSSRLLDQGTHYSVDITLTSVAAREQTLVAALHVDSNENGDFDAGTDLYLWTESNAIVTDVDVVDVDPEDETETLHDQVRTYLEAQAEANAGTE